MNLERLWTEWVASPRPSAAALLVRVLLRFLSLFYDGATRARNRAYDFGLLTRRRAGAPVISIGNLSVGGSGKTALTIWCAEQLLGLGRKPAILSRGYGRSSRGEKILVREGTKEPDHGGAHFGDEPAMIARRLQTVPVIVGADRAQSAEYAVRELSRDCLLLDDGFQHRRLSRRLDIVCLDEWLLRAPYVFPRGFLRESGEGLNRAQLIAFKVESRSQGALERLKAFCAGSGLPAAAFTYRAARIKENRSGGILPADWLKSREVIALSAIAHPENFELLLEEHGGVLRERRRFPDHYAYPPGLLEHLKTHAEEKGLKIVTTEKDETKLPPDLEAYVVGVEIEWLEGAERLSESLERALRP